MVPKVSLTGQKVQQDGDHEMSNTFYDSGIQKFPELGGGYGVFSHICFKKMGMFMASIIFISIYTVTTNILRK